MLDLLNKMDYIINKFNANTKQGDNKMTTIEIGNVGSIDQTKKIVEALENKTYMKFLVDWSPDYGNYAVNVSTTNPDTSEKELMEMVIFILATTI